MKTFTHLPSPETTVQRLLQHAAAVAPPVQLPKILAMWEKLTVIEEDLDGAGYLLPLGKLGAEIIVNKKDTENRKRFTIAHELGHWVLGITCEKKWGRFGQPPGISHALLERWCDSFATNLLMPAALVAGWLPPRDQPLLADAILRAADTFRVSDEAFFIRVWEVLRIQVAVLKGRPVVLDRSFSDKKHEKELSVLLDSPVVQEQFDLGGPIIYLALRGASGMISMSGKRSTGGRITLAVAWPQKTQARGTRPSCVSLNATPLGPA